MFSLSRPHPILVIFKRTLKQICFSPPTKRLGKRNSTILSSRARNSVCLTYVDLGSPSQLLTMDVPVRHFCFRAVTWAEERRPQTNNRERKKIQKGKHQARRNKKRERKKKKRRTPRRAGTCQVVNLSLTVTREGKARQNNR